MTDHFAKAEQILARADDKDTAPPLVPALLRRAGIHAQLAIAQAIAHSANCCGECGGDYLVSDDTSGEYARSPRTGEFMPVRTVDVGDVL